MAETSWGTIPQSASERWWAHYRDCQWCQVHDIDPSRDRFCAQGFKLRNEMIRDYEARNADGHGGVASVHGQVEGEGSRIDRSPIETARQLIIMHDGLERCFMCQEPLLRAPVFWIDQHKDGIHLGCEEQYLTEAEIDAALQWEGMRFDG